MNDEPRLTFDADGFVHMDDLPDVDPDTALAPAALERVHAALVDDAVPTDVGAGWDAMVADVDAIDMRDTASLVPADDVDLDVDTAAGPIVLVDDPPDTDPAPAANSTEFEPDAIGRTHEAVGRDEPSEGETGDSGAGLADGAPGWTADDGWTPNEDELAGADAPWSDGLVDLTGADDGPDLGAFDDLDDPLDIDVVELHRDDGDLPPGGSH